MPIGNVPLLRSLHWTLAAIAILCCHCGQATAPDDGGADVVNDATSDVVRDSPADTLNDTAGVCCPIASSPCLGTGTALGGWAPDQASCVTHTLNGNDGSFDMMNDA